jgi:hypothetical protein
MRPSTAVQCPSQVDIGGRIFHTFAMLATQHLDGAALASMAAAFGFNATPTLGVPAILGHFTTPSQPVDLAADAFRQGPTWSTRPARPPWPPRSSTARGSRRSW